MRQLPLHVLRGFLMGAADVVPGVSGGTVALVLGIYHRLIEAIRTGSSAMGRAVRLDVRGALGLLGKVEWAFFIPLVVGIGLAVLSMAGIMETLLSEHPVPMAGLFLGLVAGSVVVAWGLLQRRDLTRWLVLAGSSAVTFVLLGLRESTSTDDITQSNDASLLIFFGAGAIANCAMILPGISGSFLLVAMGMYGAVLGAVNDRDLVTIAVFGLGCVVGLALFSQVLHWALSQHYDTVMAAMIGLMVGSLRVLWPWPNGVGSTALEAPADPVGLPVVLALVGLVAVVGVDVVARRFEHRSTYDEVAELKAT